MLPVNITTWLRHPEVDCWNFTQQHADLLTRLCPGHSITLCTHRQQFIDALPTTQVALVWTFDQQWFALAPRLQWVATPAAGRDYFSIAPPPAVRVTYGEFHGDLMAETALGMILGLLRGIIPAAHRQTTTPWPRPQIAPSMRTLRAARVTILGFGHIGQAIGRICSAVGARITGVRRTPLPAPAWFRENDTQIPPSQLDLQLATTDVLVLALPASSSTNHIIDARALALLPPHAILLNLGRGNAIHEEALASALTSRTIAAAALDVFATEPLPTTSPLRACPNLLIMPHISAVAPSYMECFVRELASQL